MQKIKYDLYVKNKYKICICNIKDIATLMILKIIIINANYRSNQS